MVHGYVHSNSKVPFKGHYPVKQRRSYLNDLNHNLLTISHNLLKFHATKMTLVVASGDIPSVFRRLVWGGVWWLRACSLYTDLK